MSAIYDVLILGRGIAGAVLAEECRSRGLTFHVFAIVSARATPPWQVAAR
ncbi:MAG: hypothetical protein IPI05_05340 [Flavobacteriales bacterium]|nr:hypothetical protein [Flavobacteriales bacterium]